MSEKRNFERVSTHLLLSYKAEGDNKFNTSQLINISRGGVKFTTEKPYIANTPMVVSLLAPTSYPNKITIKGFCVYSTEKIKDMLYETAMKFQNNPPDVTDEINKYLDFLGADKNKEKKTSPNTDINKENRRFKRLNSQVLMQFIDLETQKIKSSQLVDISEGGLSFNTDEPLTEGKKIRLKMVVPTSYPDPIKIEGQVKHCHEMINNSLYRVGIEFSSEFPETIEKIKNYLQFLEKRNQS